MSAKHPFKVGSKYLIRCVTYYQVGRVSKIYDNFLVLEDASWVADTGRFADALKNGTLSEIEPVGKAIVSISSIVDAFNWKHELPKNQK